LKGKAKKNRVQNAYKKGKGKKQTNKIERKKITES
jgi:hypothetical protein